MEYTKDDIQTAHEILAHLLKRKELKRTRETELYRAYTENDMVKSVALSGAKSMGCSILASAKALYLMPEDTSSFLAFTKSRLRIELRGQNSTNIEYYCAMFAILTLLVEFYGGSGTTCRIRSFVRMGELQNKMEERLLAGKNAEEDTREWISWDFRFKDMYEFYSSLKTDDNGRKLKSTKDGFWWHIIKFMEEQDLLAYMDKDDMIVPHDRLIDIMEMSILNNDNFKYVVTTLEGLDNEQNK